MREPPVKVRILGHPLVALPMMGLCLSMLYAWSQQPSAWLLGVIPIVPMLWIGRAQHTMSQYRSWRRAWDSMAEPAPRRSWMPQLASAIIAVLVVGGFVLADSGSFAMPNFGVAVGLVAVIALPILALGAMMKSLRRKATSATPTIDPVKVVVTRPFYPVPSLQAAYHRLPDHTEQAMRA